MTLEILSFEVWTSDVIEVLKMFDTTGKNLRSWVRQGFKPYDFFLLGSDRISFLKGRSQLILISLDIPYNCFSWVVYLLVWYQHLRNVQLEYLVSVT